MRKTILVIGIIILFIGISFQSVGARSDKTISTPLKQSEPLVDGIWTFFGWIKGIFEIDQIISAKKIGNLYFDVNVVGKCLPYWEEYPKKPFAIYNILGSDISMSGLVITLKARLLINSPDLIEGETIGFGRYSNTYGIMIVWKAV